MISIWVEEWLDKKLDNLENDRYNWLFGNVETNSILLLIIAIMTRIWNGFFKNF